MLLQLQLRPIGRQPPVVAQACALCKLPLADCRMHSPELCLENTNPLLARVHPPGLCYVARSLGRSCWLATKIVTYHQSYWI